MRIFYILVVVLILLNTMPVYAQSTYEIEINNIFKDINTIILNNITDNYDKIIDYSVAIIKQRPASLETYYTLSLLKNIDIKNVKVKTKFVEFKEKYFSNIDNFDSEQAEKLILIFFIGMGIEANNVDEQIAAQKFAVEKLIQIKETCLNNSYAALATMLLFLDKDNGLGYMKQFKEKYSNHAFIPLIDLDIISESYGTKEYKKCIDDAKEWEIKYKKIISPYGWHLTMESYNIIILCYVSLKDYENAKKYYELIKVEAPKYHNLNGLEKIISYITLGGKYIR